MKVIKKTIGETVVVYLIENNGDEMQMYFGDSSFCFVMNNYHDENMFVIDRYNSLYPYFKELFEKIKVVGSDMVFGDRFTWVSDDYSKYENNHRLNICESKDEYMINFYSNPNRLFRNKQVCFINFSLIDSKNSDIVRAFVKMFNDYVSDKYKIKDDNNCIKKIRKKGKNKKLD